MPIRNVPSLLSLSLLAGVFAVQFIEEVPAPDLEQEGGEAWDKEIHTKHMVNQKR